MLLGFASWEAQSYVARKSRELPPSSLVEAKAPVLPHKRLIDSLLKAAQIIVQANTCPLLIILQLQAIQGLQKFLQTNRRDYLNLSQCIILMRPVLILLQSFMRRPRQ